MLERLDVPDLLGWIAFLKLEEEYRQEHMTLAVKNALIQVLSQLPKKEDD